MAYTTATFTATSPQQLADGRIYGEVIFAGDAGEPVITQQFYATSGDDFKAQVAAFKKRLNKGQTDASAFPQGGAVPEPTSPPPPTQADLDRDKWFTRLEQYYAVKRAVDLLIVPATDTNYVALENWVKANFLSDYVNKRGWP